MDRDVFKVDVKLGSGWAVTGAWALGGPLFLVELTSETGDIRKSRFDLQKAVFIDPAPESERKSVLELAEFLAVLSQRGDSRAVHDHKSSPSNDAALVGLRRRTNKPSVASLRSLDENEFWLQTQDIMFRFFLDAYYRPELYVPVMVASEKELSQELDAFVGLDSADPSCLLLVGQYGVGKTSCIKNFAHNAFQDSSDWKDSHVLIIFDGNKHSLELDVKSSLLISRLADTIAIALSEHLEKMGLDREAWVNDAFEFDRVFASQRLVLGFDADSRRTVLEKILDLPVLFLEVMLRYLTRNLGIGRVILVLDNLDPLKAEVQLDAIRLAQDLAASCGVRSIISVRTTTEAMLSYRDPRIMSNIIRTYVPSPPLLEVIRRRIAQAISSPEAQSAVVGRGVIRAKVSECPEFSDVLVRGLSSIDVQRLMEGLSNGSVREALQFAVRVYSSYFLDSFKIIRRITPADAVVPSLWHGHLPYYMVMKAILLSNYPIYRPDRSWVGNALGTTYSDGHLGPFLRIHMLLYLQRRYPDSVSAGELREQLAIVLHARMPVIESELKWLLQVGWIESVDPGYVDISIRGRFVVSNLVYDMEYLSHIATDVDMYPEMEARLIAPAEHFKSRLSNLAVLMEYLADRERIMIQHISVDGLGKYAKSFGSEGIVKTMIQHILLTLKSDSFTDFSGHDNTLANLKASLEETIKIAS